MAILEIVKKNGVVFRAYFKFQGHQYSKICYSRKDAKEWEQVAKLALSQQQATPPSLMYSHASKVYLQDCKVRLTPNTFLEQKRHLCEFAAFLTKDVAMTDITKALATSFIRSIESERGGKAADRRIRTLKALWNWHKDAVPRNPWRFVAKPAVEQYVKYVPTPDDISKVLTVAKPWQADLLNTLLLTGARVSEILNLTWEDVAEHSLKLWTRKRKGGARQYRTLPIGSSLLAIISAQRAITGNTTHVFINPNTGGPYSTRQQTIRDMMKNLCKKAQVKSFGFHAIRHFFAVSLIQSQQAGLTDIQLLLGHQRATTTDIYLKSVSPDINHLAAIIERAVQPASSRAHEVEADR